MKKRSLALLTLIIMLVTITGVSTPITVGAVPALKLRHLASAANSASGLASGDASGYGITTAGGADIWSFTVESNAASFNQKAFRLTNKKAANNLQLILADFKNDTVNDPGVLDSSDNGIVSFEMEIMTTASATGSQNAYMDFTFLGGQAVNQNIGVLSLRQNGAAASAGRAEFIENTTNRTKLAKSSTLNYKFHDNSSIPQQVGYIRADFDFINHTYTAWLVNRGNSQSEYTSGGKDNDVSDASLLISDQPFDTSINEFSGIKVNLTSPGGTTGVGIRYTFLKVSQIPPQDIVSHAATGFSHPPFTDVDNSITLPILYRCASISWVSSNSEYMADDGTLLKRPTGSNLSLTMTPTFARGQISMSGNPVSVTLLDDSVLKTQTYGGLTAVENIAAKTITLSGQGVNDIIDIRDVRDNYFHKLATSTTGYEKVNGRTQVGGNDTINTVTFYNAFDGFSGTTGPLNMLRYDNNKERRAPSIIAFDLGEEKNWNEVFIQFNSDSYAQKITRWEILTSNTTADFEAAHVSNGALPANYTPGGNWQLLYASKAGDELGGLTSKSNVKLELSEVSKSRYILLNIKEVSSNNDATFSQSWCEIACYLRDVKSDEYKIDYSNQIIEVDDIGSGISTGDFISNIEDNSNNLTIGVFEDGAALTPVTGDISDGDYLVTYHDNSGLIDIVRAYKIRPVLPRVTGGGLTTTGGSDVGGIVSVDYNCEFAGNDDSIITWYSDDLVVKSGTQKSYEIDVSDVGKMITAVITPKTGSLTGVPFESQERGSGYSPIIGGNILGGLDVLGMETIVNQSSSNVGNWTVTNLKNMLDGKGQMTYALGGGSNTAGTLSFSVKLNQARYVNSINAGFTGTAFKTVQIEGRLNNGYGKNQDGNDVTSPLFNINSKSPSSGDAIDPLTASCSPTLVDELILTANMSNIRYTNGISYLEAFCDVTDAVAIELDGKALELLGGFEGINENISIPQTTHGIMYSDIEYDFSNVIGSLINQDGEIIFDGISAESSISIVCSRGNEQVSKVVPFSIFNTNLFKFEGFAINEDGVPIANISDLSGADKNAQITLTGNITRTVAGSFPLTVLVAGYDINGKLENMKTETITIGDSNYSLNCGQFLKDKNITELKVFAWEMNTLLPFHIEGITAKKK